MSKLQAASQLRRAIQLFAASLGEPEALEVSTIYDPWTPGRAYGVGEYLTYGVNAVGDPQLYRVAQAHTSQADWLPDKLPALYTPLGLTAAGYPVWSRPTGAHDAYNTGDVVDYGGTLYRCTVDGNVWEPGVYGWTQAENE